MRTVVLFWIAAVITVACSSDRPPSPTQPEAITLPVEVTSAQHAGQPHNLATLFHCLL